VAFLLNDPSFTSFIQKCIQKGVEGVLDFMERKHYDHEHPENTNVRKMTARDPHMEFFNGGQWVQEPKEDVLDRVFKGMEPQFKEYVTRLWTPESRPSTLYERMSVNRFQREVGQALEWYLQAYYTEVPPDQRRKIRRRVYRQASSRVYARRPAAVVRHVSGSGPCNSHA